MSPDEFAFVKEEPPIETEKMLEDLEIPIYGPYIKAVSEPEYGDPKANFEQAQMMSMMRFECEIADPSYPGGKYVGERDANGFRHGFGTFTFGNGSLYCGQWQMGLRHGYGEFRMMNGASYKGQWANDLKHGYGKYNLPNLLEVTGIWLHDRLNGKCMKSVDGKRAVEIIYKDDLSINFTKGGIPGYFTCYMNTNILFFILFVAGLIARFAVYGHIPFGLSE